MNKIIETKIAIKKAGLLKFKGFMPTDFITIISLSFWSFKYEIMHPANVPNGKAINSQLGKLYADKIKNSNRPAPLLIINFIVLKDWLNHIIPRKTKVEIKTLLNVCRKMYQVKIINAFLKDLYWIFSKYK